MNKCYLPVVILLFFCESALAQNVFFSEDFSGGFPPGWTSVKRLGGPGPNSNWRRTLLGPQGPAATAPLNSSTDFNGWMIFDSDASCPGEPGQDVWLISPPIDASDEEAVWLAFETYYLSFNDRPAVRIGTNTDELDTWANIEVFPGIIANQFGGVIEGDQQLNPQHIYIDLSEYAAGYANIRIAFQFLSTATTYNGGDAIGCAYNWQIDDVRLADGDPRPSSDMRVNSFFAVAPNAVTPVSQIEPMGFLADIRNIGKAVQPGTTLSLHIHNSSGELVHADSLVFGAILPDETVQNVFFPLTYTPPPVVERYIATYSANPAIPDEVPGNNSRSFIFEISDTLFAKQRSAEQSLTASDDNNYTYGNVFYVPNGAGLFARHMSFSVANASQLAGKTVNTYLYRWYGNDNEDFIASPDEYGGGPVGANLYTFVGDEGDSLITVPVDLEGGSVALESGAYYIAAVQFQTGDNKELFTWVSQEYDYHATYFYSDSIMHPRYAAVIDVGNTGDLDWTGFGLDIVPVVQLSIGPSTLVVNHILPEGSAKIYPNPVVEKKAILLLDLPQLSGEVSLQLFNEMGQSVWQQQLHPVLKGEIPLKFTGLPAGTYWLRIHTEAGMATLAVVVP